MDLRPMAKGKVCRASAAWGAKEQTGDEVRSAVEGSMRQGSMRKPPHQFFVPNRRFMLAVHGAHLMTFAIDAVNAG